jgi:hypothetical protein
MQERASLASETGPTDAAGRIFEASYDNCRVASSQRFAFPSQGVAAAKKDGPCFKSVGSKIFLPTTS